MNASVPAWPGPMVEDPDGDTVRHAYKTVIADAIVNHPRSQQRQIGPSEVGVECDRRIAYKLLDVPERPQSPAWLPTIGTAVHAWLEEQFDQAATSQHIATGGGEEEWLTERRVTTGFIPGIGFLDGSCDLFHRPTGTVIDHKIIGPTPLKTYKAKGPSQQYRIQAHLYGQGYANAGHEVRRVMIAFLPRNGQLGDAYLWSEPWDPQIAADAIARLTHIAAAVAAAGPRVLAALPTADAHCLHCPWFRRDASDLTTGCPGVAATSGPTQTPALTLAGQ